MPTQMRCVLNQPILSFLSVSGLGFLQLATERILTEMHDFVSNKTKAQGNGTLRHTVSAKHTKTYSTWQTPEFESKSL